MGLRIEDFRSYTQSGRGGGSTRRDGRDHLRKTHVKRGTKVTIKNLISWVCPITGNRLRRSCTFVRLKKKKKRVGKGKKKEGGENLKAINGPSFGRTPHDQARFLSR